MNEADTRAEHIEPALKQAGWGTIEGSRITREYPIAIQGNLKKRPTTERADYILIYQNHLLAVIEAKKQKQHYTAGVTQAKHYAKQLQIRYTYSTNGDQIYQIDMQTGQEKPVDHYPTPQQLWDMTYTQSNDWRDRFAQIPYEDKSGNWQPRYYQHLAINKTLEAIAQNRQRLLLTLATGTGKTAIAFQIAWKLFHSRWTLRRNAKQRPRILFLADRNILADQAFNSFSPFPNDALIRIEPNEIRKKNQVPTNGSLFFTIFQTFMTGRDNNGEPAPYFGNYAPDFFDFIIIDECHRGGAKNESTWRDILEYFSPAVQLGLTATPKRQHNADTYKYFNTPIYTYSLNDGIQDGFLTPFRVIQFASNLDQYIYQSDDNIEQGTIDPNKCYTESDFNRIIEIKAREKHRVEQLLNHIDPKQKTLIFCANQRHALIIRNLINQMKTNPDPNYCVRITADDGKLGNQHLTKFKDNDETIPTIVTTSQKLSTGVDVSNIRNIVLLRPINSMIEFKQIIGRGTRLHEDKTYFTIYDFVNAHKNFEDKEWDGEPVAPEPITPHQVREPAASYNVEPQANKPQPMIKIKLADGKERMIQSLSATSFYTPEGRPLSAAEFIERLFGELPTLFKDEAQLRTLWSQPDTRRSLLNELEQRGYTKQILENLKHLINAQHSDVFDVLNYIAFNHQPISRQQRVENQRDTIFKRYDKKLQLFLDYVLEQYEKQGEVELDDNRLGELLKTKYYTIKDAKAALGDIPKIRQVFTQLQHYLYEQY